MRKIVEDEDVNTRGSRVGERRIDLRICERGTCERASETSLDFVANLEGARVGAWAVKS